MNGSAVDHCININDLRCRISAKIEYSNPLITKIEFSNLGALFGTIATTKATITTAAAAAATIYYLFEGDWPVLFYRWSKVFQV